MRRKSSHRSLVDLARVLLAVFISMLLVSGAISSQARRSRPPRDEDKAASAKAARRPATFGVDVNLVVLNTSVFDQGGKFVSGLRKQDFSVFEDRVEQKIDSFKQEDLPVSMGILLDTSGSMKSKMEAVGKAALLLVQASNPEDEVFIITFNSEAELLEDYTSDIDDLKEALDNITVGGGTALFDAVQLGVEKAQKGRKLKKAIVVITDGEDKDSRYTLKQVLDKIKESDVQVHTIGLLDPEEKRGLFEGIFNKSEREKARGALEKLAEETGGKSVFPRQTSEVKAIVESIAHELRNQYSIGYFSSNERKDGAWRAVKVAVNGQNGGRYKVRTRSGYYAPKP
ncbi:MAG: VWA domain-containing protein [Acidobacteria bacterium]|nr:VWA domain-containing protein [Acidobacteriota bacterium]MBI3655943.1 VWA domain-containing protein [Acidobacteriota bacterium]